MNIPNTLTSLRVLLALFIPILLIYDSFTMHIIAFFVFFVAGLTDWFDGWYARKYNLITTFGKILDPIADKVMILGVLLTFAYLGLYSMWLIIPIFLREVVITFYRLVFLRQRKVIAAVKSGKIKTVVQIGALGAIYLYFMNRNYSLIEIDNIFLQWLMYIAILVAIYFTIYSGVVFFINNWRLIKNLKLLS